MGMYNPINVAIIGTGWCGGIRAASCADNPLVGELHIAETNPERLKEVRSMTGAVTATADYEELLKNDGITAVIISATPETTHYPMAKASMEAGKHVFLEKPIALTLAEADELVDLAKAKDLKFTIGYSQRFNPKFAYVAKSIADGTIGKPVSALVSRHITRGLGDKISGRISLSPAAMEATHDIDFALWAMGGAKPVRVYSQSAYGIMKEKSGLEDTQYIIVTLDNGVVLNIGAGWTMPPVLWNTVEKGIQLPMSTMPGEFVDHVYAGPMAAETVHFIDAVARDRAVMVTPEEARTVMEVYIAADMSVERNEPINLPLNSRDLPAAAE